MPRAVVSLEVPGDLAYRGLFTRTVSNAYKVARRQMPSLRGTQMVFEHELVSAVGEAFNNIVIHGYGSERSGSVYLKIEVEAEGIKVELRDTGLSFDPSDAPDFTPGAAHESGMGLFIVRSFVDDVSYTRGPPNTLVLLKRFGKGGPPSSRRPA